MTDLQLALSIGIPSLLVLVGIFLNNARFGSVDARLDKMESDLNGRIDRVQADLSQFYMILGQHGADIANLKDRQRSA